MTEDDKVWGQEFVTRAAREGGTVGAKVCVVIHLGSDSSGKRWPSKNARSILTLAVERGYHCFLFDPMDVVGEWSCGGVTTIGKMVPNQVMAVVSACDVLLCVDNSMFKTGTYMGKKVVPLFGFVPHHDFAVKPMCDNGAMPGADDIFFAIDNWIETSTGSDVVLGEIRTFEI